MDKTNIWECQKGVFTHYKKGGSVGAFVNDVGGGLLGGLVSWGAVMLRPKKNLPTATGNVGLALGGRGHLQAYFLNQLL